MSDSELEAHRSDEISPRPIGPETADGSPPRGMSVEYREEYSSQFPHPRHLTEYERLHADSPRIIFESFEKQGDHRREMERMLMRGSERRANIGQILGSVIILVIVGAGFTTVLAGQPVAGTTIITAALAGGILTYVFGDGPRSKRK
jgi:uncharacterized membrane protein